MSDDRFDRFWKKCQNGSRSIETALDDLRDLPYEDVDVAFSTIIVHFARVCRKWCMVCTRPPRKL